MPSATRVLASFPCPSCEALLVVASRDEDVVECSQCDQVAEVPAAVRERPDLGQALDYDAEAEVREAIASYVRAAHVGPEARGWLIAGLAIAAGVLGAFTSAAPLDEPALSDWAWGAGVGLVVVMIPFGLVLQFLASRTLTRKLERGWNELAERADQPVVVYGTAVKVSSAIGSVWVHIQDGTGNPAAGTHDITVEASEPVTVGQRVAYRGTLRKDVDLGFGYEYDAMVRDAEQVE